MRFTPTANNGSHTWPASLSVPHVQCWLFWDAVGAAMTLAAPLWTSHETLWVPMGTMSQLQALGIPCAPPAWIFWDAVQSAATRQELDERASGDWFDAFESAAMRQELDELSDSSRGVKKG